MRFYSSSAIFGVGMNINGFFPDFVLAMLFLYFTVVKINFALSSEILVS